MGFSCGTSPGVVAIFWRLPAIIPRPITTRRQYRGVMVSRYPIRSANPAKQFRCLESDWFDNAAAQPLDKIPRDIIPTSIPAHRGRLLETILKAEPGAVSRRRGS